MVKLFSFLTGPCLALARLASRTVAGRARVLRSGANSLVITCPHSHLRPKTQVESGVGEVRLLACVEQALLLGVTGA